MFTFVRLVLIASLATSSACGSDGGTSDGIPEYCNPMGGGTACMMPWPSSAYLVEDTATVTGFRVELPFDAMPTNADGITIDPTPWNTYDGFGVAAPAIAAFEGGVSAEGLPSHADPTESLAADAPVVILNMETGERVLLFAEPDMNGLYPEDRALLIRPLERMQPATRYAVAIRKSVKSGDGSELPISNAFAAVVAGDSYNHPMFDELAPRYADIFAALEADGIPRDDLVLAWDFVTASDEMLTADNLAMREVALQQIGDNGANLTFTAEALPNDAPARVHALYTGTYTVPMFLNDGEADLSILQRGADGLPELVGMGEANFSAVIPQCVETAQLPVPVVIFGHGLFGNAEDYIDDTFLQEVAQDNCAVIIGGDWIGLTDRQLVAVAYAMNDVNRGLGITEKLQQAVINFMALSKITRGPFHDAPEFQLDGTPIIDTSRIYYYGASLGGIMGTVYMAYDPDILQGVIGVPGGPWSLLYERSLAWPPLRIAMKGAYNLNPWDYQQNLGLMGMAFEKVDPMTYARRVIADPLPDTPPKQMLMYAAIGDTLVNNPASWALARTMELPVCMPSVLMPYGLAQEQDTAPSGLTIYDEGVTPLPPTTNVAPEDDNGTHADVNERAAVQRQVTHFFDFGEVRNECQVSGGPAPCACETGACD